jgi:hypothetical protein
MPTAMSALKEELGRSMKMSKYYYIHEGEVLPYDES